MKTTCFFLACIFTCATAMGQAMATVDTSRPKGWVRKPDSSLALTGTDTVIKHSGRASAFIKAPFVDFNKSTMLAQYIDATPYRGQWIKISVYLKSQDLFRASFGISIYGGVDTLLTWANDPTKLIEETTDWTKYELAIGVPENAEAINFGVLSYGDGIIWMDDFSITRTQPGDHASTQTISPKKTKLPAPYAKPSLLLPINLDFEIL